LVKRTLRQLKRLDYLVNNASVFAPTPLGKSKLKDWEDLFRVNFLSPAFLCQAAMGALQKSGGALVNLTDIYGEHPILKSYGAYCASKAALIALTKNLALELGP